MAKSKIPDPLTRRHLIERELSAAQALKYAEAYVAEDRALEAVAFLCKAGERERLSAMRAEAIEAGDGFLLRTIADAMEEPAKQDEWRELAKAAATLGKERYAAEANRQAERGED